jgi:hypothetical protein
MERDWPEGRGIFHNKDKTFLTWVNEEDQLRIISMQEGGDVRAVFDRLARGIQVSHHILSISVLGLPDPHPDPLVRYMDPDPSVIK